ncbi:transposase family protein [Streptomyces sp. NPDC058296]|uniref:transposase family protein n=1 Tax=Streptomyces sp. NPDC058296 TaxID=3346432 RepID=UPI0036EDDA01
MDGTEVQVRRPRAHRPGRKAFVSGKKKQNTINTTSFSDHQGHPVLSGIVRPDRMRDRTCVRSEGIAEQFRQHPRVKAGVDNGYRGLAIEFPDIRSLRRQGSSPTTPATARSGRAVGDVGRSKQTASAYRPHPYGPPSPLYTAQQAERTLTFLASHLQHGLNGTPNLAWWHLRTALPRRRSAFAVGLTAGLAAWCTFEFSFGFGFANVLGFGPIYTAGGGDRVSLKIGFTRTGSWFGLLFGLPCAVVTACITLFRRDRNPSAGLRWSWRGTSWLVTGLTAGLAFGLLFGLTAGFANGLAIGFAAGLAGGLMGALRSAPPDLDKTVGPHAVLARDRRTFLTTTLAGGLTGAFALGLVLDLLNGGNKLGLAVAVTFGLPFGLATGLVVGLIRSVWLEFLVARIALALLGRVPWRLMSFLADAHE